MPAFLLLAIYSLVASCSICNDCVLFVWAGTGAAMTSETSTTTTMGQRHSCDLSSILNAKKDKFHMKRWKQDTRPLHLYYEGKSIPLTIETTDRISQRIVNNILIIVLKEVMRYELVEEVDANANPSFAIPDIADTRSALARLAWPDSSDKTQDKSSKCNSDSALNNSDSSPSSCGVDGKGLPTQSMVNLEVGVATGFQFDKWKKNVTEMGRLADVEGRYGCFVPKNLQKAFPYLQSWKVLLNDEFRDLFNDRKDFCSDADVDAGQCVIVKGRDCNSKESGSSCAYLLAPFLDNSAGDANLDGVGRSSPGVNLHNAAAADRSRAGRAASQTHIHSQNDLLNCQLMTSSLPVNVAYVHRSVYLGVLSSSLGASPSRPVFFFAWDQDIVHFRFNLTRLDTSTIFYDLPQSHPGLVNRSSSSSSSLRPSSSVWDKCDHLLHEVSGRKIRFFVVASVDDSVGYRSGQTTPGCGPTMRLQWL